MKGKIRSFARRSLDDQRGQILPLAAVVFVACIGMGGLTIDVGRAYVAQGQLQNYANAAALAAAGVVYNTSSTNNATTYANNYSASSGDENVNSYPGDCDHDGDAKVPEHAPAQREHLWQQLARKCRAGEGDGEHSDDLFHEGVRLKTS